MQKLFCRVISSIYFFVFSQLGLWRAVHDPEKETFKALGLNWLYLWILQRKAETVGFHHGIGRHTQEELAQITETDLKALSDVLGIRFFPYFSFSLKRNFRFSFDLG